MGSKQLRIGITCYPTFGGSGVIATEIGMAMARRGHRVHFICYDIPGRLQRYMENIFFHEVEVHDYPLFTYPPYSLSLASKMVEVSTYEKLDLLHVHYAVPHATSAYLARSILGEQAPTVITTLHGTDITLVGNERSYLPITRFSIAQSDGVTAPSRYLQLATYDKLNLSTDIPIETIPNFVDIGRFVPMPADEKRSLAPLIGACPIEQGLKILTHVSNFRPVKRVVDVVAVFAKVAQEIPSRLILIGDGPERSRVEASVRDLGLADKVCFLGKQEDFVGILQRSDLFLLPSESESFGLAALEAMSCGVPVVASNVQGIPEVVVDGVTGFLSDVGAIERMASNAVRLLSSPTMHQAFSQASRDRVVSEFNEAYVIDLYEDYYFRTIHKRLS
ncbi:MAG: N-acetyl-alpha-D-glucosaminyl L-malate synthase BshA [Bdellovibrionales bacterium]|nr:N-acetyl-alpha-D-glucosaminyl L-malate synthase BshA [Bdellovibrionales bacterium]